MNFTDSIPYYIFLLFGLIFIFATSVQFVFKEERRKGLTGPIIFFVVGTIITAICLRGLYHYWFDEFPSTSINSYTQTIFKDFNTDTTKLNGEDGINIKTEWFYDACNEEYCQQIGKNLLFLGADINKDNFVTYNELHILISSFDSNKDGILNNRKSNYKRVFKNEPLAENQKLDTTFRTSYGKKLPHK